jgi:hypothetical protein
VHVKQSTFYLFILYYKIYIYQLWFKYNSALFLNKDDPPPLQAVGEGDKCRSMTATLVVILAAYGTYAQCDKKSVDKLSHFNLLVIKSKVTCLRHMR